MTSWLQINIKSTPAQIEALADFVFTLSGRGVQINDEEQEVWELVGFLDPSPHLPQPLQDYLASLPEPYSLASSDLPEQDWHQNWRRNFSPFELTEQIWIAPPWEEAPLRPGQFAVIIDPGQAFGTGRHQSTQLCLLHLQDFARKGEIPSTMLDVGCGTGILSLTFLRLGGKKARAIDIDPLALAAARHNAILNRQDGLQADATLLEDIDQLFPLLAANLTAADLCRLAPRLSALVSPGGRLLASGMLRNQKDRVAEFMACHTLTLEKESDSGEWASLVFRKEAAR
ncbi:MAG: 50S ribosomal protein L11 methyltransferase [Desulfarculales bacterium]|jgi:ribosomal protein L11 methyltransferase|nr:50S ribosomal protein L11 methyltransferase [Desulfarculales bacterium]